MQTSKNNATAQSKEQRNIRFKKSDKTSQLWFVGVALLLISGHWAWDTVSKGNLLYQVNGLMHMPFFETRSLYLYMHIVTLVPVLALSFDKKVAFYKEWRYLLPALFFVAIFYWVWDIGKTVREVWGFNPNYYTTAFLYLPLEEWLFFITFPWASVFIYLCLNAYFPKSRFLQFIKKIDTPLSWSLIIGCLGIGFLNWGRLYTTTSFWIAGFVLWFQYLYGSKKVRHQFYRAFPIATIPFVLINAVWTGSFTEQPVVVYNPEEYLGLRFLTIPLDDFSYNFGLQLLVIMVYEKLRET